MLQFKKFFLILVIIYLFFPLISCVGVNQVDLYFFEGQGCPHCARMKGYIEGLKVDYPNLKVYDFEVYFNKENQMLFRKMAEVYGVSTSGVPTIFIDNEVIVGENFEKVKNAVEKCSTEVCISPIDKLQGVSNSNVNVSIDGFSPMENKSNEIIGWIVISFLIIIGIIFLIILLKKKSKKIK